jgi:PPK2 family polyphosphate:nucleotide phosphotransferase
MKIAKLRARHDGKFRLKKHSPDDTLEITKEQASAAVDGHIKRLETLHELLYAEGKHALLIVLQGMDAAGKDGTIKHVMSGVNPQGCAVTPFKQPTKLELAHDFLWRVHAAVPARGYIGIFNRSHYEDVLITRVHNLTPKNVWETRYRQINQFEEMLSDNGVQILKFFLHISKDEQERRFEERLHDPDKNWKASPADFAERRYWADYQKAYEDAIAKCSTKRVPWYIIPADHKWFRDFAVSEVIVQTLESLRMKFPEVSPEALAQLSSGSSKTRLEEKGLLGAS